MISVGGVVVIGSDGGGVPTTRTVAGAPLSADVTTPTIATALGLGAVTATGATAAAALAAVGLTYTQPQTPAIGPFSATAYLYAASGYIEPSVVQGTSLAVTFYKRAGVSGVEQVIVSRLDAAPVRGWALGVLTGGAFYFYAQGPGAVTLGSFDGLATGMHTIALSVHSTGATSFDVHYSIDGGAVSTASYAGASPVVPADTTTPLYVGRQAAATSRPLLAADIYEITTTSTEVSDADLQLLSAASTPQPAVATGTVVLNLLAYRDFWPGYATATTGAGSQVWGLTVAGSLARWNH